MTPISAPTVLARQVQLGYNNIYSASVFHGFLSICDDSTGVDTRYQLYAAMG